MGKSKNKWKLVYWSSKLGKEVTVGFKNYEDMVTRRHILQKSKGGWNFREMLR